MLDLTPSLQYTVIAALSPKTAPPPQVSTPSTAHKVTSTAHALDHAWPRRVCCESPTRAPSACHAPSDP
eukprot:5936877-Prymnesium_polylepis.1